MQKSTVFLLVVALASAGVSAGLWLELRAERALNTELSERLNAAAAIPMTPVEGPPVAPPPITTPVTAPVAATAPPAAALAEPAAAKATRVAQGSYEDWQAQQRRLMRDPSYREVWREQRRLQMAQRRDNLIQLLGFTPAEADAITELSIDRQMSMFDRAQIDPNSEDFARLQKERFEAEERAHQAKLRELLGEEKSAQLQTYMESRQSRMQVDRFRTQLTAADALRDDQVEPLITALHTEQALMNKEMQEYGSSLNQESDPMGAQRQYAERQAELMKATHRRMHSAATGILSSSQLEKLDALLKRDFERLESQQRMARIQSKLDPPAEASGNSN